MESTDRLTAAKIILASPTGSGWILQDPAGAHGSLQKIPQSPMVIAETSRLSGLPLRVGKILSIIASVTLTKRENLN